MFRKIKLVVGKVSESIIIRNKSYFMPLLVESNTFQFNMPTDLLDKYEEKIIFDANKICNGIYQIFDYEEYKTNKIPWSTDPVTLYYVPPKTHQLFISSRKLIDKIDIKNFWEQSNQHWLVTLGQAYLLSADEKFTEKAVILIMDWIRGNPCAKTINWKCPMDIAIRIINWIALLTMIDKSVALKVYAGKIDKSIYEQILYIRKNLENSSKFNNNHYICNLVGLIWGSVYFKQKYGIDLFYDYAINELDQEIKIQILTNGTDYEMSTYYHVFVTEILTHTIIMLRDNNQVYPESLNIIIEKMIGISEQVGAFTKNMPLVGDQDGSRLFHTLGCFNIDRCDFSDLMYFYQPYGLNSIPPNDSENICGLYHLYDNHIDCFVKCGPIGTGGKGTHDHNDHLSVSCSIDQKPFLIDLGTGIYSKDIEIRNEFRSTKAHNTLFFYDEEQNTIDNDIFLLKSNNESRCIKYCKQYFLGEFCYSQDIKHMRSIILTNNSLEIKDEIIRETSSVVKVGYSHLHLNVVVDDIVINDNKVEIKADGTIVRIFTEGINSIQKESCKFSPSYGVFAECTKLIFEISIQDNSKIIIQRG